MPTFQVASWKDPKIRVSSKILHIFINVSMNTKILYLVRREGQYYVSEQSVMPDDEKQGNIRDALDISTDEWKEMLTNSNVFDEYSLRMVLKWYMEEDHQGTSKAIMLKYDQNANLRGTPYNGIVVGLGKRIMAFLNHRFVIRDSTGRGQSFWSIPFWGWHVDYDRNMPFVWKLRPELALAIENLIDAGRMDENTILGENKSYDVDKAISDDLESQEIVKTSEGRKIVYYTTRYERKRKNRDAKIQSVISQHKPLRCECCDFDFEQAYGEYGKNFIEVHHNKPLHTLDEEVVIDPVKDLNCVCSNCHRMIHRDKGDTLSIKRLRTIVMRMREASNRVVMRE